jgi:hypothetical protein
MIKLKIRLIARQLNYKEKFSWIHLQIVSFYKKNPKKIYFKEIENER